MKRKNTGDTISVFFYACIVLLLPGFAFAQNGVAEKGRKIFDAKCTSCHTIGGGKKVGPDLRGVTNARPGNWLAAFISNPNKMFASNDPTAQKLLNEYKIKMPDLGLSAADVNAVIAYLDQRQGPRQAPPAAPAQSALEEKGEQIFNARCISCHTIGGGKKIGPDLQGVTTRRPKDWLIAFISNPNKVFAANDPTAVKLLNEYKVRMPNLKLSPSDVNALVAFLQSKQEAAEHAERPITRPRPEKPSAAPLRPGSPQGGMALFTGDARFARDGPPCISCHNVTGVNFLGGGNLGPDLTTSYSRFGEGMVSVLTTITFPTMRPIFANNPLSQQEISDLMAYFKETASGPVQDYTARYIIISGIAFIVLVLIGLLIWRKRLTGVRKALVQRAEQEKRRQ